jgi:hypothetical protein
MNIRKAKFLPPFFKGGQGGFYKPRKIPLNPPLRKGDFKQLVIPG